MVYMVIYWLYTLNYIKMILIIDDFFGLHILIAVILVGGSNPPL